MVSPPLLAPFESLLNRNIAASTPARGLLATLAGRAFAIEATTPQGGRLLRVRLVAEADGVRLGTGAEPTDATVTGSPLALASLLRARDLNRVRAAGVTIAGDAEVAQSFERLLELARPDLEEELAHFLGDVPAHYLGGAARAALDFGRQARDSLFRNIGEFLNHEGRDVVPGPEQEVFLGDVDRLREDVDRAESRLALLEAARARQARP